MPSYKPIAARIVGVAIVLLIAWVVLLLLTRGIDLRGFGLPISSRNPTRPAVVAVALAAIYLALFRRYMAGDVAAAEHLLERASPYLACAIALSTLIVGLRFGNFVAGGSDSYGYLSQADLWVSGQLRVSEPLAARVPWPDAVHTLTPSATCPVRSLVCTFPHTRLGCRCSWRS